MRECVNGLMCWGVNVSFNLGAGGRRASRSLGAW